jgi:CBS domain-containing protein
MKVADVMTPAIVTVDSSASLVAAAKKMKKFDIGFLVIVSDSAVIGTVTDRDIVIRGLAEEKDAKSCSVQEVASTDLITCTQDADVAKAAKLFSLHQIQRVLVVDYNNAPVGVLSLGDIAAKIDNEELIAIGLKHVKKDIRSHEVPETTDQPEPKQIESTR